jgi:hypothetical protein
MLTFCYAQAPGAKKTANSAAACSIHLFRTFIPIDFSSMYDLMQLAYLIIPADAKSCVRLLPMAPK